jgi:hypothetical protein
VSTRKAAGIIASLSPQTSWDQNKRIAAKAILTGGRITGHTGANVEKASECKRGIDPEDVLTSRCRPWYGLKVLSFFRLIANPTDSHSVVIDRHAVDIALGYIGDKITRKILERKDVYDYVADAYRKAADDLGILPWQVQAVTWLHWRRCKRTRESTFTSF